MSKFYEIQFSPETSDAVIQEERRQYIISHKSHLIVQKVDISALDEKYFERVGKNIMDERINEKSILKALFQAVTKKEKDLSVFNEMADNVSQIDNSNGTFKICEVDLKRIREAFKDVSEQFKMQCFKFPRLMKQLENPKEVD